MTVAGEQLMVASRQARLPKKGLGIAEVPNRCVT